jgi:hypothetical protein
MNMNSWGLSGGRTEAQDVVDHKNRENREGDHDRQVHEQRAFDPGGDQRGFRRFFVGTGLGFLGNHCFHSEQAMIGSSSALVCSHRRPSSSIKSIAALGPQVLGAYC